MCQLILTEVAVMSSLDYNPINDHTSSRRACTECELDIRPRGIVVYGSCCFCFCSHYSLFNNKQQQQKQYKIIIITNGTFDDDDVGKKTHATVCLL